MLTLDLADIINREINSTDVTIPSIKFWLLSNVGMLNNLLSEQYTVVNNEYEPELSDDSGAILATLYMIRYYNRKISANLGGAQYDWSELKEDDSSIRRVSKNEIAKTYRMAKNDLEVALDKMALAYKKNRCIAASLHNATFVTAIYSKVLEQP